MLAVKNRRMTDGSGMDGSFLLINQNGLAHTQAGFASPRQPTDFCMGPLGIATQERLARLPYNEVTNTICGHVQQ